MIGYLANEAIILWQVTYAAEKKPGQDFVPMINLLLPPTLQPTFRTDPLNAHDVTDVIARDCESVNAESTKEVYQAALERHPESSVIYIISDNARYYHNKKLKEWADGTKIKRYSCRPIHQTSI